jgi:hypothetical protein
MCAMGSLTVQLANGPRVQVLTGLDLITGKRLAIPADSPFTGGEIV